MLRKFGILVAVLICVSSTLFCYDRRIVRSNKYELPLVVIIPSYNNLAWCEKCLDSVLSQQYENFRAIFIDDCSSDGMGESVARYLAKHPRGHKVELIRNKKRHLKMANLYRAARRCHDDEIIVELDGDDWYADENVLNTINSTYLKRDIWMTYGNHKKFPPQPITNPLHPMPTWAVKTNSFRSLIEANIQVQLRTFRAWLFKQIALEDLFFEGHFVPMSADSAIMLPMYEMAGERFEFIGKPIYVHNLATSLNDHKVDGGLQARVDRHIRMQPGYKRLEKPARQPNSTTSTCDILLFLPEGQNTSDVIGRFRTKIVGVNKIFICANPGVSSSCADQNTEYVETSNILKAIILSNAEFVAFFSGATVVPEIDLNKKMSLCRHFKASGFHTKINKNILKRRNIPYEKVERTTYAYQVSRAQQNTPSLDGCILDKAIIGLNRGSISKPSDLANILALNDKIFLFEK